MTETHSGIRLVVFDLGGVLVRIVPWAEAHAPCGYPMEQLPPQDDFLPRLSLLNQAYDRGELEPDAYETKVAAASGGRYLPQDVRRVHAAISTTEYPGLHALFDDLDLAGLEIGVLSNTNVQHWRRLSGLDDGGREYPLVSRAAHAHASFLLRCSKPDPRIYDAFARAASARPSDILFFDDLERNVEGARGAGWRAELINPRESTEPQIRGWLRAYRALS